MELYFTEKCELCYELVDAGNCYGVSFGRYCKDCFDVTGPAEDLNHVVLGGWNLKDCRNTDHAGHQFELIFDSFAVFSGAQRVAYSYLCGSCQDIRYCYNCQHSTNLFGCVGVKHKSYCILNKQYTKEDYEAIVPKIIEHMGTAPYRDKKGRVYRYGESLPAELSPWAYNETIANEYFSLDRALALEQGYAWKDPNEKHYTATRAASDLPDHIDAAGDDVLKDIVSCEHGGRCKENCTSVFKITQEELRFYRRMHLPLPRLCPSCRHYGRIRQRNPITLHHRVCECNGTTSKQGIYRNTVEHIHGAQPCQNGFETSYAPDHPEIVYCEACYNAEVV